MKKEQEEGGRVEERVGSRRERWRRRGKIKGGLKKECENLEKMKIKWEEGGRVDKGVERRQLG